MFQIDILYLLITECGMKDIWKFNTQNENNSISFYDIPSL